MRPLSLLAILACLAAPAAAQQDTTLSVAVRLATEGQGDSARALVRQRLASLSPTDSLYPEILYAAGVVAADVDSAITYFRRVGIEHARSAWADHALLRLAQLAFASGDYASAHRSANRILTDYPLTEVLAEASFWAGRAQLELGQAQDGCRLLTQAEAAAGTDVELANRAQYHLQRCAGVFALRDSVPGDTVAAAERDTQPETPTVFAAQLAAVQSAAAADELMRALHAAGYQPHVVREDGYLKIRVGRFADRPTAQRLVAELRRRFGGSPFVVEER
ncbi:MAG: hypothetical protein GTN62_03960 [Gemmatimonadales bacterium]|nr:hypothetical protein [Gemmatimonadales bacterium]NIN10463.1 hypothetical protein [Gemmatimonadales bacterium]NIN49255.1 hypothetical protein [Gemmatimonadales bacterium]NIP06719.1 hypothetical protein [Gemmatimonadales bacterium]NIR00050.1 hypothetical protein [Gemmatimonadales bacterium]